MSNSDQPNLSAGQIASPGGDVSLEEINEATAQFGQTETWFSQFGQSHGGWYGAKKAMCYVSLLPIAALYFVLFIFGLEVTVVAIPWIAAGGLACVLAVLAVYLRRPVGFLAAGFIGAALASGWFVASYFA